MSKRQVCLCLIAYLAALKVCHADDRKTASEIIKARGFNYDEFDVLSQGYVLKAFRIINPLADSKTLNKIPVVAHHGISFDAANMMASSANSRPRKPKFNERVTLYKTENGTDDRGLYFYLSNNNYDVWVIQARGVNDNVQRKATEKSVKSFWDFSIDEQALIDLPTLIEFILKKTNSKKVAYVSYSESTTFMFALLSMRPEFSEKLLTFIAMAPVVFTGHLKGLTFPTAVSKIYIQGSVSQASIPSLFRKSINFLFAYMCSVSYIRETLCRKVWEAYAGPSPNSNIEGGLKDNLLKATSLKAFEQFAQNSMAKDFRMYDYRDNNRNMEEYGQVVPPYYNVSKINLKTIVLFRGTNDYLSNPEDQMILISRLRVPLYEDHIMEDYSHIGFLTSRTITKDINEPVLKILDKLSGRQIVGEVHTLGNVTTQQQEERVKAEVKVKGADLDKGADVKLEVKKENKTYQ